VHWREARRTEVGRASRLKDGQHTEGDKDRKEKGESGATWVDKTVAKAYGEPEIGQPPSSPYPVGSQWVDEPGYQTPDYQQCNSPHVLTEDERDRQYCRRDDRQVRQEESIHVRVICFAAEQEAA
jgi:hypothetical protein